MEQNKVRTYLLYAIGEIALVMIGILLALQVNNWNEQKKIEKEELQILTTLRVDILQAAEELEAQIERQTNSNERIKILLTEGPEKDDLLDNPKIDSLLLGPIWQSVLSVPVIQTYSDLKSSGDISIIQNRSIREALARLESGFQILDTQFQDLLTVQQMRVDEFAIHRLDLTSIFRASLNPDITGGEKNDYRALFSDRTIKNTMAAKLNLQIASLDSRTSMLEACENLVQLINEELSE